MNGEIERLPSGMTLLDKGIESGFPRGGIFLIDGDAGSGKSTFCTQIIQNAAKNNEPVCYVLVEELPKKYKQYMPKGFNLQELMDKNLLIIFEITSARAGEISEEKGKIFSMGLDVAGTIDISSVLGKITKFCESTNKAKVIVIDSISSLLSHYDKEYQARDAMTKMYTTFSKAGYTVFLVCEAEFGRSRLGIEEYVADGVISLRRKDSDLNGKRSLEIHKLRGTKHSREKMGFDITAEGLSLFKAEEA